MNATMNVIFYLKRVKTNEKGLRPIFLRITIDGKRLDKSIGKFIDANKWNSESSKMKGTIEESRLLNNHLELLRINVFEIEKSMLKRDMPLIFEDFKNEYLGIKEKERMLIPVFKEYNRKIKELVGVEYASGTLERYETSLKYTKDFLLWKYNITDVNIEKIDHSFVIEYEFYLRSERKCANNTAVKYIKNFHKIINICLANGWLNKDPFANYKAKVKEVVREFLTEEEIEIICNKEFVSERLELVRDIFIFSCFTGLAYIDVKQLTNDNISIGIDGDKWIFKNRQKNRNYLKNPIITNGSTDYRKIQKSSSFCK